MNIPGQGMFIKEVVIIDNKITLKISISKVFNYESAYDSREIFKVHKTAKIIVEIPYNIIDDKYCGDMTDSLLQSIGYLYLKKSPIIYGNYNEHIANALESVLGDGACKVHL